MPILSIASTKGGVGKSTLAVNLCVFLINHGQKVVLLDADPQGTISKWQFIRQSFIAQGMDLSSVYAASAQGEALLDIAFEKSKQGYLVLIDSAGMDIPNSRNAILRADYVLTISAPTPQDLWEIEPLIKVVESIGRAQSRKIPTLLVFNRVSPNPSVKSVEDALKFMDESMIFPTYTFKSVIKDRIAYQHSFREGKGVTEYNLPAYSQAKGDMIQVCEEFLEFLKQNQPKNLS